MIPALEQFPRFEKGSPSSEYQQIVNFCTNYLEGMLVGLMHQEVGDEQVDNAQQIARLQQRMLLRERTIRHAFQFQIEKYFSDFKSISRTRLRINRSDNRQILGLSNHKATQIFPEIESITRRHQLIHQSRLTNIALRLKKLVHRSDGGNDDNPVTPLNLCNAFQASIDALGLSISKNLALLKLFDITLKNQLENFYQQIDLGFFYLDILPELTDPALFVAPEADKPAAKPENDQIATAEDVPDAEAVPDNADSSLQRRRDKKWETQAALDNVIGQFRFDTENGTLNYERLFAECSRKLLPLLPEKQQVDVEKFSRFYTNLLNNSLISTPLKTQLSRLSSPLLQLVLIDPFFFRSSAHPVNDFLQSIIDFELRFKHRGNSLLFLSRIIDELLQIDYPGLSDYQPLIVRYEAFKEREDERLTRLRDEQERQQADLKKQLLEIINDITSALVVEQETLQFFYDDWQLYLLQLANQSGMDSDDFHTAVKQARILSWMLDERNRGDHPDHPEISFKTLLKKIDQSLGVLNFSGEHRTRIRKQLVREYKLANQQPDFSFIPSAAGSGHNQPVQRAHDETQPLPVKNDADNSQELQRGDWVEIRLPRQKKSDRAKLQWISSDRQQYTFIDQRGHKVYQCDRADLNRNLGKGRIKRLPRPRIHRI